MSNVTAFCFHITFMFWILCMNLFIYVRFHSILQQDFRFDSYFCCFLLFIYVLKGSLNLPKRVSDDRRTWQNICIKYWRTLESWKILSLGRFFSMRFRYWRKNCMRYELLVLAVNHASGLHRSHGSRKDRLNSTKNRFTSMLAIILEITIRRNNKFNDSCATDSATWC